jgi:sulfate/thiosulfate transport system permease protein
MRTEAALPPLPRRRVLPGFSLTLGLGLFWTGLIVLLPMSALLLKAAGLGPEGLFAKLGEPRTLAALKLSFSLALAAAAFSTVAGLLVAWVLERYRFPGRRLLDALVDLPFALPTAVAGIALTALYSANGWIGRWLEPLDIEVVYTRLGISLALVFVGLPFVIRSVQPVLAEAERELEEAAATLGASPLQSALRVVLPTVAPAALGGFGLAFARGVGEYGSVIFIAGNLPQLTEIAPLLIVIRLEEFDYAGAAAIGAAMLALSFSVLLLIHLLQTRLLRHGR